MASGAVVRWQWRRGAGRLTHRLHHRSGSGAAGGSRAEAGDGL